MSDAATRKRKARARDSAMRELVRQGCHVWDVTRPGEQTRIIAFNPDVPVVREIMVCVDRTSVKDAGRLHHRRGVSPELWFRPAGDFAFRTTKL